MPIRCALSHILLLTSSLSLACAGDGAEGSMDGSESGDEDSGGPGSESGSDETAGDTSADESDDGDSSGGADETGGDETGGTGGAGQFGEPELLAVRAGGPIDIQAGDGVVYWSEFDTGFVALPLGESEPTMLAELAGAAALRLDGEVLYATYWGADLGTGGVVGLPTDGSAPVVLAEDSDNPGDIAVDEDWVFWGESADVEQGFIWRAPKDGSGEPEQIFVAGRPVKGMDVRDGELFWINNEHVATAAIDGTSPQMLAPTIWGSFGLALDEAGRVVFAERDQGVWVVSASQRPELLAPGEQMQSLAIDDSHVWVLAGNALRRVPLGGGELETIYEHGEGERAVFVAVDDGEVYWTVELEDGAGEVWRLPGLED